MTTDGNVSLSADSGHPRRWYVLVVCCAGLFLLIISLTSLNVALPDLQEDLGADASDLQWIVDAYAVVFGGLLLTGGAIGDRIGRRAALLGGFALVALSGVVGAVAGTVATVIVARVIMGLGAALMMPATLSAITEVFHPSEQGRAIAIWSGIAGAGGAFGPAIGGWLLEISWWGSVFVMNAVVATVGLIGTMVIVPRLPASRTGALDLVGSVLSMVSIGLLLFAIIEAPSHWSSPRVVGSAVGGVVAVALFLLHERTTPDPMLPLRVLQRPRLRVGAITLILAAIGFAGVIFVGSLLLQIGWGEGPLVTGLLLLPIGVSELAISSRSVRYATRFGANRVVVVGLVIMAVGYITMALTPVGDRIMFVVAGLIAGLGNGLVIPPSIERIVSGGEPALAGVTAGVNETSVELGASLGVAVLGGVQRVVFDRQLPDGVPSRSVDAALAAADSEVVVAAFRTASNSALFTAAALVLLAIVWAHRSVPGDEEAWLPGDEVAAHR